MRILYLEDDDLIVRSVRRGLRSHDITATATLAEARPLLGLAASVAAEGQQADIDVFVGKKERAFDVVIVDVVLEDGVAWPAIDALESPNSPYRGRVIVCTAGPNTAAYALRAARMGPRFIEKPFRLATLAEAINQVTGASNPLSVRVPVRAAGPA